MWQLGIYTCDLSSSKKGRGGSKSSYATSETLDEGRDKFERRKNMRILASLSPTAASIGRDQSNQKIIGILKRKEVEWCVGESLTNDDRDARPVEMGKLLIHARRNSHLPHKNHNQDSQRRSSVLKTTKQL